ncbi:MAG: carbohydrate-binding family V/XII, partial [Gammaproteobacteria bacterium]|nr:carbohydrate-binding family V/XII [Gammaproteobacteria bacterium]
MAFCLSTASAHAVDWPQEVTAEEGTIVVYQPQPESLDGNVLKGRAAMSLELTGRDEPIFGAFWFESRIDTNRETGIALIRDVRITQVRWPDSRDADEQRFTVVVEKAVPENGFEISMERLAASLESAETVQKSLDDLKSDPPDIVFREALAVLLVYDGEPRYSEVEGSGYERVLNTPFVVVRKQQSSDHWLSSGKYWYQAQGPMGPWTTTDSPPRDLAEMVAAAETDESQPEAPPAIVAANKPTELIVSQGKPNWLSLPGGALLYVQNTETPWLRELSTNNMYVLLSGRWYRSKSQEGPWVFVRADELPASFADIPPESDIGGLRASVAGTEEAQEALLDAQIPQTTAIRRDEAILTVEYDGAPSFESIPGTSVAYGVNTGAQVLRIDNRYYAVDNGVWFASAAATGPWVVADSIPADEIAKIPPSSPVYNTTHVHVYESTPEVVYVGYTPGYLWSFPYYGVPVYGTGWYYPPYYGRYYYPRPPTWGFHVGYNPWTGWNFGMSWSNGFFSFGMSWGGGYGGAYRPWGCCGGWYGGGYRGPVVINTGDINIGNSVNIGNRTTVKNRIDSGTNRNFDQSRTNLYDRPENRSRNADRATVARDARQARPA